MHRRVCIDVHASVEEAGAAAVESWGTRNFRLCLRAWALLQCCPLGTYVLSRTQQRAVTDLYVLQPSPQSPKGTEFPLSALKCSRGETCSTAVKAAQPSFTQGTGISTERGFTSSFTTANCIQKLLGGLLRIHRGSLLAQQSYCFFQLKIPRQSRGLKVQVNSNFN